MALNTASAKSKYVIQRHARAREPLPTDNVKLARPPQLPPEPTRPNLLTMLPTVFMALSTGAISFFVNRGTSTGARSVLTIIPMIMMGAMMMGIQLWVHRGNVKKQKAQVVELEAAYQNGLKTARERLEALAQKQQRILHQENPPTTELLKRVQRRDRCLWERQPNDNDFLTLRLGAGRLPLSATIKVPEQEGEDPRFASALQLATEFEMVEKLPITTNLNWLGTVGVRGQKSSDALYLAYSMVASIVSNHSPDEVYLYVLSHRHDAPERWGWLRWLPHTNALRGGQGGVVRLSFAPGPTDEEILLEISQTLRQRGDDKRRARRLEPHLVIIFDETPSLQGHQVMGMLLGHDPNQEKENLLQASAIFIQNPVPPQVNAMIEVRGTVLDYRETWMSDSSQIFHQGGAELATLKQMEQLSRSMAPLRTEASYNAGGGNLPGSVRLVELVGATQPDQIDLDRLYSKTYDPKKVMAFPIGLNIDLKPQIIVLRENGQGGHGSHAMLAGMTGTGKSVLLQGMVLAMALTNSPAHLNFVLADFKGGASELAKLQGLPHLAGFVTDLNPAMVERFRISLESEVRRRKELFDTAKESLGQPVANIRTYNKLCPDEPLPHLVVLLDEFAHGLNINPNFRGAMDTIAAQGRALGVHLVLSTQRAADFDGKIRPNIDIRMSLRVASREDSKTMFNRDEAYTRLQRPGQAYVQVGDNEIFEMFQTARADVPYQPEGTANLELVENFTIYRVLPDGRRHKEPLYEHQVVAKNSQLQKVETTVVSEAEILVSHIQQYCKEANYSPVRQIALPPLPLAEKLPLISLLANEPAYHRWHGNGWSTEKCSDVCRLRLPLGMEDVPARQEQISYILDFNQGDGNLMIVGPTGAGKFLLLRSLVLGLALTHTPAEVNFYILSRGAALTFFEAMPHCQGNVIRPAEGERQNRLFSFLEGEVNRRRALMREARVDSLTALRQARYELVLPTLFLIIEDYAGFRADHEMAQPERLEQVSMLAREGRAVDLHLIVTSNDTRSVQKLRDNVRQRLALGMKSVNDYMELLEKRAEVLPEVVGRGYVVQEQLTLECQIAAPTPEPISSLQETNWLKEVIGAMNAHWSGYRPLPVVELPSYVELTWLWAMIVKKKGEAAFLLALQETWGRESAPKKVDDIPVWQGEVALNLDEKLFGAPTAVVGIEYETQRPFAFELMEWGTYSLLVGPAKSGKTDILLTLCLAAAYNLSPEQLKIIVFEPRQPHALQPLIRLPHVQYANSSQQAKRHLTAMLKELEQQAEVALFPAQTQVTTGSLLNIVRKQVVLIVDDLLLWMHKGDGELFKLLDDCVRVGQEVGLKVVLADTSQNITQARQMQSAAIMIQQPNGMQTQQMYQVKFVQAAFQYGRGISLSVDASDSAPLAPQVRLKRTIAQMNGLQVGRGRGVMLQESEAQVLQFARLGLPDESSTERRARLKHVVEEIGKIYGRETAVDGES